MCELKIAGIIDSLEPYEQEDWRLTDYKPVIQLLLNDNMYKEEITNEYVRSTIYISTNKPYEIDEKIEEIKDLSRTKSISEENLYKQRIEQESNKMLIKFILYAVIVITNLFCIFYMFNIISSSVVFRKRDFAILKSIGMSQNKIDKMLFIEAIFYGLSSIIFGIIYSFIILYFLSKIIIDTNLYTFEFPVIYIIYAIIMVYTIIAFGMINGRKKIKRQNIIDDL